MDADQVLAFRLARSGLAVRGASSLAEAAACPASDFARDAALLALAARAEGLTRDDYHTRSTRATSSSPTSSAAPSTPSIPPTTRCTGGR